MRRSLAFSLLVLLCWSAAPTPAATASEADAKKEYRERMRDIRRAGDPRAWLRLGTWIEEHPDLSEKTRERWLRYIRHQYGVAARKKLADDDVHGWLTLAREMKSLLGSDSVTRSYLREGLKKNPEDPHLAAALGDLTNGARDVASIHWTARKAAADQAGTPEAFAKLADWCASLRGANKRAEDWYDYCVARELYLSGREGTSRDPIRRAVDEAERSARKPLRKPDDPRVTLPSHLQKRKSKGLTTKDFESGKTYRLESSGRVTYSDTLPTTRNQDAVWKRGTSTTVTTISQTQVWLQDKPAWWAFKWDEEAAAWVVFTSAERRAAAALQLETARKRLAQAENRLKNVTKRVTELPESSRRSRGVAERIARKGGKLRDFRRALTNIVSFASQAHYQRTEKIEAQRSVAAWEAKIAQMESGAE